MTVLEGSYALPTVMFPSCPLWPVLTIPKCMSLVKVICANGMARCLDGTAEKYSRGVNITTQRMCGGGCSVGDFCLWPQYRYKCFLKHVVSKLF